MIPKYLHGIWTAAAPALGNHLWQSTLFAVVAGLLTLLLKKNHARARYWLWLAASVKFLIPFSLLVGIGTRLAWSGSPARTNAGLYFALEEVSRPFTETARPVSSGVLPATVYPSLVHLLPVLLVTMAFRIRRGACRMVRALAEDVRSHSGSGAIAARTRSGGAAPDRTHGRDAKAHQDSIVVGFSGTGGFRHRPPRVGVAGGNLRTP
jgi:hypothetical protein